MTLDNPDVMEVALVFDRHGHTLHWHEPREGGLISDADALWEAIWAHREILGGVAHTHPWVCRAAPSHRDLRTFSALERGLGRPLWWPIVTDTHIAVFSRTRRKVRQYSTWWRTLTEMYDEVTAPEPYDDWRVASQPRFRLEAWEELRLRSGLAPASDEVHARVERFWAGFSGRVETR